MTGATVAFVGLGSEGRRVLWRRVKEGGEEMTGKVVQRRREREEARTAKERSVQHKEETIRREHQLTFVLFLPFPFFVGGWNSQTLESRWT